MLSAEVPVQSKYMSSTYTLNLMTANGNVPGLTNWFSVLYWDISLSSPSSRLKIESHGVIRLHNAGIETIIRVESGCTGLDGAGYPVYTSTDYMAPNYYQEAPFIVPEPEATRVANQDPGDTMVTYAPNLVISPANLFANVPSQTNGVVKVTIQIRRLLGYYAEWNWIMPSASAVSNALLTLTELRQVKVMT